MLAPFPAADQVVGRVVFEVLLVGRRQLPGLAGGAAFALAQAAAAVVEAIEPGAVGRGPSEAEHERLL